MSRVAGRTEVPHRTSKDPIEALSLSPEEGYVLSQIDDRTCVADLALIVGLPASRLDGVLRRLVDLGLIQMGPKPSPPRSPTASPGAASPDQSPLPRQPGRETWPLGVPVQPPPSREAPPQSVAAADMHGPLAGPASATGTGRGEVAQGVADTDGHTLPTGVTETTGPAGERPAPGAPSGDSEWGVLTPAERQRITTYLLRAESADFYELLGVSRHADRSKIRRAYFTLAKEFHPDAYYGRNIGRARRRLERIFQQITRAYEVLSRPASRQQYDEYLRRQAALQGYEGEEQTWQEDRPCESEIAAAETDAAGARVETAEGVSSETAVARESAGRLADGTLAAVAPVEAPAAASPPATPLETPAGVARPTVGAGDVSVAAGTSAPAPRTSLAERWQRLRTARQFAVFFRRPWLESAKAAKRGSEYLADAEAAAKEGRWGRVSALVELAARQGLSESEQIQMMALRERSAREIARISYAQAQFAETTGDLEAALEHVERACRFGTDNAKYFGTAARLYLRLGRKLQKARDAAHMAIQLDPRTIAYRLTLIQVYLAAGLAKNARREAEAALAIEPENSEVKMLLAEACRQHDGRQEIDEPRNR